ncbi:MAG: hypothetical protein WAU37_06245 [Formosimonas sp.]
MTFKSNAKRYTEQQCKDLFAAVLADDVIEVDTWFPDQIHLDYTQEQLIECFQICHQVWAEGFIPKEFDGMIKKLYQQRSFTAEEQLTYKHVRAKFKQLRFAFANFDEKHKYPFAFNAITVLMGTLQDAFKNGQPTLVGRYAQLLRIFLTKIPVGFINREMNCFKPCSVYAFRQHVNKGIDFIRQRLVKTEVTGREFHSIRKIISRQASFYVALTVLYPSKYHSDVFRYLSTINGMMGRMNDVLVEKELSGTLDYHKDLIQIPDDIKQYLQVVVDKYAHLTPQS